MSLPKTTKLLSVYIEESQKEEIDKIAETAGRSTSKQAASFLLVGLAKYKEQNGKSS